MIPQTEITPFLRQEPKSEISGVPEKTAFGLGVLTGGSAAIYEAIQLAKASSIISDGLIALVGSVGLLGISALGLYRAFKYSQAPEVDLLAVVVSDGELNPTVELQLVAKKVSEILKTNKLLENTPIRSRSSSIQELQEQSQILEQLTLLEQHLSTQNNVIDKHSQEKEELLLEFNLHREQNNGVQSPKQSPSKPDMTQHNENIQKIEELEEKIETLESRINSGEILNYFYQNQLHLLKEFCDDALQSNSDNNLVYIKKVIANLIGNIGDSDSASASGSTASSRVNSPIYKSTSTVGTRVNTPSKTITKTMLNFEDKA